MRGNAAILKCTIPSFVSDFVHVVAWIDEDGHELAQPKEDNFSGGKNFSSQQTFQTFPIFHHLLNFIRQNQSSYYFKVIFVDIFQS